MDPSLLEVMREAHYLQHEPFNMKMPTEVKMLMRNMSEQVCIVLYLCVLTVLYSVYVFISVCLCVCYKCMYIYMYINKYYVHIHMYTNYYYYRHYMIVLPDYSW